MTDDDDDECVMIVMNDIDDFDDCLAIMIIV